MEKSRIPPGPLFLHWEVSGTVVVFDRDCPKVLLTPRRSPRESIESVEAWEGSSGSTNFRPKPGFGQIENPENRWSDFWLLEGTENTAHDPLNGWIVEA